MTERVTFADLELRVADDGDGRTLEGIAVPYDEVTEFTPHGAERFLQGAMAKTAHDWGQRRRALKVLRNHDTDHPIGHVVAFDDTPGGLRVSIRLADTTRAREAVEEVREGLLDSMSIGFRATKERKSGKVREVVEAALAEISLVPVPAYAGALVESVRQASEPIAYTTAPPPPLIPAWMLARRTQTL